MTTTLTLFLCLSLLVTLNTISTAPSVMAADQRPHPLGMTKRKALFPQFPQEPTTGNSLTQAALPGTFSTSFRRMGKSQVPFVSIVLDDGKSYLFALDPGTPNTSIDRVVAADTGLEIKPVDLPTGGRITTLMSNAVLGDSRLKLSGALFVVEDLSLYRSLYPGFAGILGANLLGQFRERLDFTAGQVDFVLPSTLRDVAAGSKAITLAYGKGKLGVSATVDGHIAVFSLSTLYDATIIHTPDLLSRLKPKATLGGLPAGDGTPVTFLRLSSLSVGGRTWSAPVVEAPFTKGMPEVNILGLDFLHRFYVTLDLSHRQIFLEPDPAYQTDAQEWDGLGIVPAKNALGQLVIAAIGNPSPARDAGLKIGDELTAIQGLPTAQLSLEQEAALVKRPVGTPIKISVRSGANGKERRVYLKVKRLL